VTFSQRFGLRRHQFSKLKRLSYLHLESLLAVETEGYCRVRLRASPFTSWPTPLYGLLNWIAPATLPVGIQIMAPLWEDATSITFADLLAREVGGFTAPTGYQE
jgi:hypothetical protein